MQQFVIILMRYGWKLQKVMTGAPYTKTNARAMLSQLSVPTDHRVLVSEAPNLFQSRYGVIHAISVKIQ